MRNLTVIDEVLALANRAAAVVVGEPAMRRPYPLSATVNEATLTETEREHAAALMRVNHVGEVCAQALYEAQAMGARDATARAAFRAAAHEEEDHLAWTRRRIDELGGRPSLLNPLWYAGAFGIGLVAARLGDRVSLGFMAETERQVEQHLAGHLERLPAADTASRAVVEQMRQDEERHGTTAMDLGGVEFPLPARAAMQMAARVMTSTAYYV